MPVKKKIIIAFGTRPELIRFAPIIHQFIKDGRVKLMLVHTGQHFSDDMNGIFFRELNIPKPDINLSVGEFSPNEQIGRIIIETGKVISKEKPDAVCVWGDTNSSLGVAIATNKNRTKLFHLEAGCRSHDFRMAEEYNRILIDQMSDLLFPLSQNDADNLATERIHGQSIFLGDPLYDVFLENQKKIEPSISENSKQTKGSILLTLHRAENVDNPKVLENILNAIGKIEDRDIIFPIHPRTKKMIASFGFDKLVNKNFIKIINPLGYLELIKILHHCDLVITDSGGLQKEAFFARKTCVTLRKSTEWLDTTRLKVNILLDPEEELMVKLPEVCQNYKKTNKLFDSISEQPYGDGRSAEKIVDKIIDIAN